MNKIISSIGSHLREYFSLSGNERPPAFIGVRFDQTSLDAIRNIRQRCEHRNNVEVIRHAIATYDVLTECVARGETILIVGKDGSQDKLDLFPIEHVK